MSLVIPFVDHVGKYFPDLEPKVVLDIGTRDMMQAYELADAYPTAEVYAFECHPLFLPECRARVKERVHLVEKAVHDKNSQVMFRAIRYSSDNPGASSIFKPVHTILGRDHSEHYEEIIVPGTTVLYWAYQQEIPEIDLVWMDVQGAELLALKGFGSMLANVKAIHTEVETTQVYDGSCTDPELKEFLESQGFKEVWREQDWECEANVIYVNTRLCFP